MKMIGLSIFVLAAAGLAAAPAAAKPMTCAPVTTAAVEAQFKTFNDGFKSKNPDTVTALFAPGGVLLATVSNTPRTTPAEIRDYFVGFLKNSPVGTIESSTVMLGCNKAVRAGLWNVNLTDPATGQSRDVKARYTFVYKYVGGKWQIAHLHSSMLPEAPAKG